MRNRLFYILLGIIFSFSFVRVVNADTTVSLGTNGTSVSNGTKSTIAVYVKSDVSLSSCLFQISNEGDLEFVSVKGLNGWNSTNESSIGTYVKNSAVDTDLSEGLKILEIEYKINGNGSVKVETLNCNNASGANVSATDTNSSISFTAEDVEDKRLSSLHIGGGMLTSTFSPSGYVYDVKLSNVNFSLDFTTRDERLSDKVVVKHNGKVISNLNNIEFVGDDQGTMLIQIVVDEEIYYELKVRYQKTGLDNTLKSVTIAGKELMLETGKYDYEFKVSKDVETFKVEAILNDSENFKFKSIGNVMGTANFSIEDYVDLMIVVSAKDASFGIGDLTYNIRVTKEGSSKPNTNPGTNPNTGGISMYIMFFVLVISLIGSMIIYRRSMENY